MTTKFKILAFSTLLGVFLASQPLVAQDSSANNFKSQFNSSFNYASRVLQLAKAMPADKYDWRPMEGVSSVGEVYKHIAGANLASLQNSLGIPAPEGVNLDQIGSLSSKEEIVAVLEKSINHVRESIKQMPVSKLSEQTESYGRKTNGQGVLVQLLNHMSEHVGQSIAYARMNKVVPPWNE